MAENKKSFVLYADLIHTVRMMPKDKAGELFLTILSYVNDENPVVDDLVVNLVFEPIKRQMKRDLSKYESIKEKRQGIGREGGIKSGEARREKKEANEQLQAENEANEAIGSNDEANEAVTVTDTVTVTVINKEAKASMPSPPNYSEIIKNKGNILDYLQKYNPLTIDPYADIWNIFATERGLSTVQAINDSRRRKFKVRIREKPFDFLKILNKAKESNFLKNSNWFSFDWIIENDTNYLKILEGNYENEKIALKIEPLNNLNEQLKSISKTTATATA